MKAAAGAGAVGLVLAVWLGVERNNSNILFEKGLEYYFVEDFDPARQYFRRASEISPESSFGINGRFYWGLTLYRQKRYQEAAGVFRGLVERFPESMHAPESMYHIALCLHAAGAADYQQFFQRTVQQYPGTRWAQFSRERLQEADFQLGMRSFDSQNLEEAQRFFLRAARDETASPELRAKSQYFLAVCEFKRRRWKNALEEFSRLLAGYPDSTWVAEALYHVGLCHSELNQKTLAEKHFREVIRRFPQTHWANYARDRLGS